MFLSFQFGLLIFCVRRPAIPQAMVLANQGAPKRPRQHLFAIGYRLSAISFEPQARMTARMTSPSLIRKELTAHGDLDPITFWILNFANLHRKVDCAHDAIPELFMDQLFDRLSINQSDFVKSID
jgi:hypothetical protein